MVDRFKIRVKRVLENSWQARKVLVFA